MLKQVSSRIYLQYFFGRRCDLKDSRKNSVMEVKKAYEEDVVFTADEGQESGLLNILTQPSCQVTTMSGY